MHVLQKRPQLRKYLSDEKFLPMSQNSHVMCCKIYYEYDLIFRVIMKLFLIAGLLINSCTSKSVARQGENDIEEYKLRMSDQDPVSGMEKSLNTIPQFLQMFFHHVLRIIQGSDKYSMGSL